MLIGYGPPGGFIQVKELGPGSPERHLEPVHQGTVPPRTPGTGVVPNVSEPTGAVKLHHGFLFFVLRLY